MANYTEDTIKNVELHLQMPARRILQLKWTDKVSNTKFWKMTKELPIENETEKRKWRWIGHTLRKPPETFTLQANTWNPPGKRRRGRPRNTWQRNTGKKKQRKLDTPGEKWRGWPQPENDGVPWSMVYAPSEQTAIRKLSNVGDADVNNQRNCVTCAE